MPTPINPQNTAYERRYKIVNAQQADQFYNGVEGDLPMSVKGSLPPMCIPAGMGSYADAEQGQIVSGSCLSSTEGQNK